MSHVPVLLHQAINLLNIKPEGTYVDGTFGGGGHSQLILDQGGKVIGIDQDETAIAQAYNHPNLTLVHDNVANLKNILASLHLTNIDGLLLDLGTSNMQLRTANRGFSFQIDEPLDMRMSQTLQTVTAKDLIAALGRHELSKLFRLYGDEPMSSKLANAIVDHRKLHPITTTGQLAELVAKIKGGRHGRLHPATKVFQALRIAVNDELNSLKQVLADAVKLLKPDGRLVIISFHEGEDRIVKQFFKQLESDHQYLIHTHKPITPSQHEILSNPQSRSAKLRAIEKPNQ